MPKNRCCGRCQQFWARRHRPVQPEDYCAPARFGDRRPHGIPRGPATDPQTVATSRMIAAGRRRTRVALSQNLTGHASGEARCSQSKVCSTLLRYCARLFWLGTSALLPSEFPSPSTKKWSSCPKISDTLNGTSFLGTPSFLKPVGTGSRSAKVPVPFALLPSAGPRRPPSQRPLRAQKSRDVGAGQFWAQRR